MAARIILLNGTSSAGKTTLARALQARLETPYLHVCIDAFEEMMPKHLASGEVFARILSGFHHSIRALALASNDLIVDHVLVEDEPPLGWVPECLGLIADFPVHLVGVRCPLGEAERREAARGDRPAGLARWQSERMHRRVTYDVEIDTSCYAPDEAAAAILTVLSRPPTALAEVLRRYAESR